MHVPVEHTIHILISWYNLYIHIPFCGYPDSEASPCRFRKLALALRHLCTDRCCRYQLDNLGFLY